MAEAQTPFDVQCLEALKSIGKTLGQMSLYKIGHPAVSATLKTAEDHIGSALAIAGGEELVYTLDHDKLIANGRIVGVLSQVPNSIKGFFTRFKLNSLTFRAGIQNAELEAFIELASSRADAAIAANPQEFMQGKGVTHILFNEAIYSKVGAEKEAPPPAESAESKSQDEANETAIAEAAMRSLDDTIRVLVNKSVSDPLRREAVYKMVMQLLQQDIQRRIDEVVKPLEKERNLLKNEQARTQNVLNNMAEGVIVVDEQGKIMMMNPAAEQIYGTKLVDVAGKHLADKIGEEHLVTLAKEITTPSDRPVNKEVAVAGADDTKRTLKSAGAVVQNEAGKVVGMVSSLSDAAKHKDLQRMQRDFVAHVTHELRAPLSSIKAALEILQGETQGKLKEEEARVLATALKNSDRLADLISSILDFSKIESGQMTVYPRKGDAEKIAREAVDSLAPWASKKKVGLSLVAAPNLPPVSADSGRTIQVLVNLLSNAIKFTPAGGQITVRAGISPGGKRFADGDHFIEFSVADTGAGIPKAEHKRIFEKFVQIASGEMHVGGTGLGLAIAKALIHLQSGKMWLESDEGKGATFYFTLPVWVAGSAEAAPPAPKAAEAPKSWWKRLLGL